MEYEVRFMRHVRVIEDPVQQMEFLGEYICLAFVDRLIDTGNSLVKARAIRSGSESLCDEQTRRIETSYRFVYAMRAIRSLDAARDHILSYPILYGPGYGKVIDILDCLLRCDTECLEDFLFWYSQDDNAKLPKMTTGSRVGNAILALAFDKLFRIERKHYDTPSV